MVAALVCAGLFAVVTMRVLLIQGQARIDELESRAAVERARTQRLSVTLAELEAPDRVTEAARQRLGMVVPPSVTPLDPASSRSFLGDLSPLVFRGT